MRLLVMINCDGLRVQKDEEGKLWFVTYFAFCSCKKKKKIQNNQT